MKNRIRYVEKANNIHTFLLVVILLGVLVMVGLSVLSVKSSKTQNSKAAWDPRLDNQIRCNESGCQEIFQRIKMTYISKYPNGWTNSVTNCLDKEIGTNNINSFYRTLVSGGTVTLSNSQLLTIENCMNNPDASTRPYLHN